MFIITVEQIKETSLKIDYIIEEIITNNNEESLSPLVKNLFDNLLFTKVLLKTGIGPSGANFL